MSYDEFKLKTEDKYGNELTIPEQKQQRLNELKKKSMSASEFEEYEKLLIELGYTKKEVN